MAARESGVTLIDVVIGTALLIIIIGVAYPGFIVANNTIITSGRRDLLERAGDQLMKEVIGELRSGLLTDVAVSPNPPSVSTLRPQASIPLSQLSDESQVPWDGQTRIVRFRQTGEIRESDEGEDINRDGDRKDRFATGLLELVVDGRTRPLLTRVEVIAAMPGFAGDMDGDGIGDLMFEANGRSVTIRIFLVHRGDRGRILTTAARGAIHLRNQQQ